MNSPYARVWGGPGIGWVYVIDSSQQIDTSTIAFKVGDIATRGDGDRHLVEAVNDAGDMIEVRCITAAYWCEVGDVEWNMAARYSHAGAIIEGAQS